MKNWLLVPLAASFCLPVWLNAAPSQDVRSLIDELSSTKPAAVVSTDSRVSKKGAPLPVITDDMLYRQSVSAEAAADKSPKKGTLSKNAERDVCLEGSNKKSALSFYDVVVLAMCNNPKAKTAGSICATTR